MRTNFAIALLLLLGLAWGFVGCSSSTPRSPTTPDSAATDEHDHTDHDLADHHASEAGNEGSANADIVAAFAKLSADDRALAEKQRICPVTGELLGSMGAPIKVDVAGQPVFICCEGCQENLLAKPDEYLAKLKK
ncbi:MAG: hypothetical protein L0228_18740 [Planctomycetes bacterium]|nr:hypothetical protein [Planctomycetota bacterium]